MEQKIKFPRSQKVYLPGKLYPNIRVAMRKVEQVPSRSHISQSEKLKKLAAVCFLLHSSIMPSSCLW